MYFVIFLRLLTRYKILVIYNDPKSFHLSETNFLYCFDQSIRSLLLANDGLIGKSY